MAEPETTEAPAEEMYKDAAGREFSPSKPHQKADDPSDKPAEEAEKPAA